MFESPNAKCALSAISLLITLGVGFANNVDTDFPIVFNGTNGSYFGYTTALLYSNKWGPLVLVGAPRSNTSFANSLDQPGALFRCNITDSGENTCQEVEVMTEGPEELDYSLEYRDMKDGMWLGGSLDVSRTRKDIVICGHLWRNKIYPKEHLANGVCYVLNDDLDSDSIKLLPLLGYYKRYVKVDNITEFNYAYGQAGTSAIFTEDGSNLILGAPGILSSTGSLVDYLISSGTREEAYRNPTIPNASSAVQFDSYFGYSVTTGKFVESDKELYAVGAPRDGKNFAGKVYIIDIDSSKTRIHIWKQGFQMGEYFGGSVLGMDIDGDSWTDLLVGAPTNSQESGGDEGRVYVYISRGKDLVKSVELTGDNKVGARFGTALANVGDTNQDGFDDVAIGAPYEDGQGAVYIYHCSKSGIKTPYAQKIEATQLTQVEAELSGFGIHISRGLDIDKNGYPDFVVGSYISSHAVLFRSRPVISVSPDIVFTPEQIDINQTLCSFGDQNLTCVKVDACLKYTGKHVPAHLEFGFTLSIEDSRGFLSQDGENESTNSLQEEIVEFNQKNCSTFVLYLSDTKTDIVTPVPVQFSSHLVNSSEVEIKFNKTFVMYDPSSPTNMIAKIPFQHGCGNDGKCQSNLNVTAERTQPIGSHVLTLGEFSSVSVTATVTHELEPAYSSRLHAFVPPELSISSHDCKNIERLNSTYLLCNIGNPLKDGTQEKINLKLDATKIPPLTKHLEIKFEVDTKSTDMNSEDNITVVALNLQTIADFGVTGQSSHDQIMCDGKNNLSSLITHSYIIRNYGPSALQTIDFELRVPYAFSTEDGIKPFFYISRQKVDEGIQESIPATCNYSEFSAVPSVQERRQEIINDDAFLSKSDRNLSLSSHIAENLLRRRRSAELTSVQPELDLDSKRETEGDEYGLLAISGPNTIVCGNNENILCATLRCTAAPFNDLRRFTQVSVDFELNFDVLNDELGRWYEVEFVTSGSVSVRDAVVKVLHNRPKVAHVTTIAIHEGPLPVKIMSPWIIFVSIGVGALLLLIILIILVKVGFFRRKEKDKMKELMDDTKKEEENPYQDIKDTEDLSE